ncbi:YqfQ family protein [Robertmurraya korlensis]|uniref:YqfQ family protein n=1 Tax=Robertmurraya korlensis TaxID=519977 RepID=UPI0020423932|nr:YqfQ family protein [Robertmurraya korlensis]MCM3599554.1 YqfQ family protein [Robertmurraya korlensis]
MPPRQPFPVRGGMPQPMLGFGRNQMRPMMPPVRMGNMGMNRAHMGGNAPRGMRGPTRNSGGGLLSKLLGKGKSQGAQAGMQMFGNASRSTAPAAGGGLLKSLADPTAITGFLNNTQRVLQTAQQIGPMVQQYGPIVKNLPAMWKLYRGLNAASSDEETKDEESVESTNTEAKSETKTKTRQKRPSSVSTENDTHSIEIEEQVSPRLQGKSVPKIYV